MTSPLRQPEDLAVRRRASELEAVIRPFHVEVDISDTAVQVTPVGELDMATAPQLQHALSDLWDAGPPCLLLDLHRLTFIDSTGLHLALAWQARATQDGVPFSLVKGPRAVQRAFELADVSEQLPFLTQLETNSLAA
jgi:anti-sigma B factor antagonist